MWDNFINSKVGKLYDKKSSPTLKYRRGCTSTNLTEENCATYKEPATELGQSKIKVEHALPKTIPTKGKRSRRVTSVMNMKQHEVKEEIDICIQADGKRRNSCGQKVEQRS